MVPGFNDSDAELESIARFIAGISVDIPWHVTAFRQGVQDDVRKGHTGGHAAACVRDRP